MNTIDWYTLAARLEQSREQAMVHPDASLLEAMLSENLYYGHSGGYFDDKRSFLEKFRAGSYKYAIVKTDIDKVTPIGDNGLVINGLVMIDVELAGKRKVMHSIYLAIWRLENGNWRFLAHQTTLVPS